MSFSEIEQIQGCRSLQGLSELWHTNVEEWSRLPREQARELIRAKNEHKAKLELFEEWSYWFQERAAIMEYEGRFSRKEAETLARERLKTEAAAC